jgi:hypothetical protein
VHAATASTRRFDAAIVGGGLAAPQAEVARFSHRDADRLPAYYAMLDRAGQRDVRRHRHV